MELTSPAWLWLLLVLPVLAAGEVWAVRRDRQRTASVVARSLWPRVVRRPAEAWRWARLVLILVATACVIVALSQPRWGIVRERIEREGVDVVLVIDTSASMGSEDVEPNRLFLARAALARLLDRLSGDRFALVAFEGDAYPLVPLTLDADAVGLFLDTLEPGLVPAPGTSLGAGLAKALDLFVDPVRANKTVVLVSDGEDLEGEIAPALQRAKTMGVTIHTVGVGSEHGSPVPNVDSNGQRAGFKKAEDGTVVVSRLNEANLKEIARATGGQYVHLTLADSSLWQLANAIEAMEQKTLQREFSYRKKERYQWPLGAGLAGLSVALLLPFPLPSGTSSRRLRARLGRLFGSGAVVLVGSLLWAGSAFGQEQPKAGGSLVDEVTARPQRLTAQGRTLYQLGDFPRSLERFESSTATRPVDARTRFNLADALLKNGKLEEAATLFRALGADPRVPLAAAARYNLGNALLTKQDFPGAVTAYRDALKLAPDDPDTRHNLELALRAIQRQQQEQQQNKDNKQDKQGKQQKDDQKKQGGSPTPTPQPAQSPEQKEQERFQRETGMSKERAMQLLAALQQNEKDEQRKLLAALRGQRPKQKDW